MPQIVRAFGVSFTAVGVMSVLPFVAAALGVLWWGARSDRLCERRWHLMIPSLVVIVALIGAALTDNPTLRLSALVAGRFGALANLPVFWTLPSAMLAEAEAPAGLAVVSSIGNVAGFVAPYVVGVLRQVTGSFSSGMLALAGFVTITVLVAAHLTRGYSQRKQEIAVLLPDRQNAPTIRINNDFGPFFWGS
ncbi:MFS transporter [Paraburkholderia aspalathi]|nr:MULTISPECIES: MFS transporter [Paraburkholderia]MBK3810038.1 MFS transporter [Paraburkholderia aspalathi]